MTSKHIHFAMIGALGLIMAGCIGALVLGNNILAKQASVLYDLKLENRALEEQQTALKKIRSRTKEQEELRRMLDSVVPKDKDQAKAVREIVNIASETGMSIATIKFPDSTLGAVMPRAPAARTEDGTAASATPAAPKLPSVTQVQPVEGIPGVYAMPIEIKLADVGSESWPQFLAFLKGLEKNRRTAQVSQITINPVIKNQQITGYSYLLSLNIFVRP